eukprot:TRINITY_DN5458_c0_g1_i1.p3 TRINITY_DN5458_c0_g1~~TRINITY_DN5458_c0_g1_i1.p3  ORF type:complete len:132 (-),score=1.05 TRINITY_DN5458_c0_g1_i1:196-591(-)
MKNIDEMMQTNWNICIDSQRSMVCTVFVYIQESAHLQFVLQTKRQKKNTMLVDNTTKLLELIFDLKQVTATLVIQTKRRVYGEVGKWVSGRQVGTFLSLDALLQQLVIVPTCFIQLRVESIISLETVVGVY